MNAVEDFPAVLAGGTTSEGTAELALSTEVRRHPDPSPRPSWLHLWLHLASKRRLAAVP